MAITKEATAVAVAVAEVATPVTETEIRERAVATMVAEPQVKVITQVVVEVAVVATKVVMEVRNTKSTISNTLEAVETIEAENLTMADKKVVTSLVVIDTRSPHMDKTHTAVAVIWAAPKATPVVVVAEVVTSVVTAATEDTVVTAVTEDTVDMAATKSTRAADPSIPRERNPASVQSLLAVQSLLWLRERIKL